MAKRRIRADDLEPFESHEWIKDPMEFILAEFFDPLSRGLILKTMNWALENLDSYSKRVLKIPRLTEKADRVQLEEILKWEIIFTVMQMCEDLVYLFEAYRSSNPDPVTTFRHQLKATNFFADIDERDDAYLLDILSVPHSTLPKVPGPLPRELTGSLKEFRTFMIRLKEFYFKHLEVYNHHKHGHRFAFMNSLDNEDNPTSMILSLPEKAARNTVIAYKADDIRRVNDIASGIMSTESAIRKNWLLRRRDEPKGKWHVTIPFRIPDDPAEAQ